MDEPTEILILEIVGPQHGDAAVSWLVDAMDEDRAEAQVHTRPEMTVVKPARLLERSQVTDLNITDA